MMLLSTYDDGISLQHIAVNPTLLYNIKSNIKPKVNHIAKHLNKPYASSECPQTKSVFISIFN